MLSFIEKEANFHVEEAEEAEGQEDAEGLLGRRGRPRGAPSTGKLCHRAFCSRLRLTQAL